jgi:hypothetical protein
LVAEGSDNNVDRSLEQALATSSLENGFLIHRTPNLAGTAVFLDDLTKHMRARLKKEKVKECLLITVSSFQFEGHSFDWHQDESRKTKEISVSDCFLRQLTVCPQVSAAKANEIIQRFPSFRALHRLYKNSEHPIETTLSSAIPTIPFGVSKQMGMFFKSQHPTYSTSL